MWLPNCSLNAGTTEHQSYDLLPILSILRKRDPKIWKLEKKFQIIISSKQRSGLIIIKKTDRGFYIRTIIALKNVHLGDSKWQWNFQINALGSFIELYSNRKIHLKYYLHKWAASLNFVYELSKRSFERLCIARTVRLWVLCTCVGGL